MPTRALCSAVVLAATAALAAGPPTNAADPDTTGTGTVYMVNPVQSSGDQSLTDQKDSASAVPASEFVQVELRNLDGSGTLSGRWADIRSSTGKPASSATNTFHYDRDQDQFEQVMAYFWINEAQEYLQSLGFGSTLPPILDVPFQARIDQYGVDNSYFWDKHGYIRLGKGGVDDAEDAEVIVHEYGHAVHSDQVEGFGSNVDAGAIGESFGDYLAVSVGLDAAEQYRWPVRAEEACPMDWDAVSYTSAPHCIRRFDRNLTVADRRQQVHFDGQIWSQALWEIRAGYPGLGLTIDDWNTTLINSQFDYAADTSWADAARTTYQEALERDGAAAAALVQDRFAARGITF